MQTQKKILVVDDENDTKALFEQQFRKEIRDGSHTFAFAHSGEDALSYLIQHKHEVVLILSDINMPGMSGLELLQKIKQLDIDPAPKVMMITAYADEVNCNNSSKLGADDFFIKPINFKLLREKLKS